MRKCVPAAVLVLVAGGAHATLIDRGDGFIYDDVQDITWTQDANINGRQNWADQMAWAAGYSQTHSQYGLFDDWRLPTTLIPDSTCDGSFGVDTGLGCTGSEMGHLTNVDGISDSSMGPFTNVPFLEGGIYWSSTARQQDSDMAWVHVLFISSIQYQYYWPKDPNQFNAWAVRDGDIAPIPEPSTFLLVSLGLVGLARIGFLIDRTSRIGTCRNAA